MFGLNQNLTFRISVSQSQSQYHNLRKMKQQRVRINHVPSFCARDYFDEVQASINIASSEWKIQNLCVWNDLVVETVAVTQGHGPSDDRSVEEYEAEAEAAAFAMVKSKIANLCSVI